MVAMYSVLGRQVGSHWLAMATLGAMGGLTALSMGGSTTKKATQGPPINAQTPDEESFIKDFLKQAEQSDKKAGSADPAKK